MHTSTQTSLSDQSYLSYKTVVDSLLQTENNNRTILALCMNPFAGAPGMQDFMQTTTSMRGASSAIFMRMMGQMANNMEIMLNSFFNMAGVSLKDVDTNALRPLQSSNYQDLVTNFNGKLVTHERDGSLNMVVPDHLRALFEPGKESEWPELILTSTHALASDHTHISGIMRGFRRLAADTFDIPINLIRRTDLAQRGKWNREQDYERQGKGEHAVIVSAVSTESNAWLNGANLLSRLSTLRQEEDDFYRQRSNQGKEFVHDTEEFISPAAKQLAKTMLKLMVENPNQVNVNDDALTTSAIASGEHIMLRSDARAVAQHIKLTGYSKGGNTVTDAMRYLVKELRQTNSKGEPIFQIPNALGKKPQPLDQTTISSIVRNIGLLSVAAGEVPLTEGEKAYGIRRLSVINRNDMIAKHFTASEEHKYVLHDDLLVIPGDRKDLGHKPEDALGYGDDGKKWDLKTGLETKRGFLHDDPEVHDRLSCFFASTFGKSAVADVTVNHIKPDGTATFDLEFAPGVATKDGIQPLLQEIQKQLQGKTDEPQMELQDISSRTELDSRRVLVTARCPHERSGKTVAKRIDAALTNVAKDHPELIISQRAHHELQDMGRGKNLSSAALG